jgi:hypothetical protein
MKRLIATAALVLSLTTVAHADDVKAFVRMTVYDHECAPLPDAVKLAFADVAERLTPNQIAATTADVHVEFDKVGRSKWCAVFRQAIDRVN